MMQGFNIRAADVHAGALADVFDALEGLNGFDAVIIFLCHLFGSWMLEIGSWNPTSNF
jgi:hypothetical protein